MIYVFLVDTGTMMTFEMNLALENVSVLKGVIQRAIKVPPEKQVLLVSGGEALDPNHRVCQYSAGTDTNPIFLFSKSTIEGQDPPAPSVDYGGDTDLKTQVEGTLNMPPSYNTVVARTQLAQQFHEQSRELTRTCQQLVHDQHLQQQGWAAVVANLEDIVSAFRQRYENFEATFAEYLKGRDEKFIILQNFDEDLKLLSRIPVFPELLGIREGEEDEEEEEGGVAEETKGPPEKPMTLLDWISAKDSQSDVRQLANLCYRGLTQISEGMLTQLGTEVSGVIREADRPQMKEVKGLGERLCGLEQLMHDAQKVVQEQLSFSQALLKNQDRAGKVNDQSIFPDLCTSHRKNLMHMLKNHQKVQDIKRRCIKAKEELSENLHVRLKWIMYIERKLYELDTKISMHHENVRRLTGLLQVVDQIHRAPRVYAAAITEVARRHAFSADFMQWVSALSEQSGVVWRKEVEIRREFLTHFSTHFLASLFPGMEDLPPDFATQPPGKFDEWLPKVTTENIEHLRAILPELQHLLVVGEVVAIPPILSQHYSTATGTTTAATTTRIQLQQQQQQQEQYSLVMRSDHTFMKDTASGVYTSAVTSNSAHDREDDLTSRPRDHQESHADIEDFEKVGGSDGVLSPMEVLAEVITTTTSTTTTSTTGRVSIKTKEHFSQAVEFPKHMRLEPKSCAVSDEYSAEAQHAAVEMTAAPRDHSNVLTLQEELSVARIEIEQLHHRLNQVLDFKGQITNLKEHVKSEGSAFLAYVSEVSSKILNLLIQVQNQAEVEKRQVEETKNEEIQRLHELVDLQTHQLSDAHRELEVYRDQIHTQEQGLQQASSEIQEMRRTLEDDRKEEMKRLTLEHEVEMEDIRQQVSALTQEVQRLEIALIEAREESSCIDQRVEERVKAQLQKEKDKIVQILESSFTEREKNALDTLRERMEREKQEAIQQNQRELLLQKENILSEARKNWEVENAQQVDQKISLMVEEGRRERDAMLEECQREHRMEVESLRSRFKIVTTHTPPSSTSPLEELDRLREELERNREREMEETRSALEQRFSLAREEERRKMEEEKQILFNETIRSINQDKERVIEDLRMRIELLSDESERLKKKIKAGGSDDDDASLVCALRTENVSLKEQCEQLQKEVIQLSNELARAKRFSFVSERSSDLNASFCETAATTTTTSTTTMTTASEDVRRLQKENQELRDRLSRSASSLVEGGRVTLSSCQPGDSVLIVWDSAHLHFRVLLEHSPHLHFLHGDSYTPLGLSKENPQQRLYCPAEVVSKEFCQAKKDENRFRVPKGTRFYRVLARCWDSEVRGGMDQVE